MAPVSHKHSGSVLHHACVAFHLGNGFLPFKSSFYLSLVYMLIHHTQEYGQPHLLPHLCYESHM